MKITTDANLLSIENRSFIKKETGEEINYKEATLVVDGEVFRCTVDKSAEISREDGKGEAVLDLSERNGKMKLRLVNFA